MNVCHVQLALHNDERWGPRFRHYTCSLPDALHVIVIDGQKWESRVSAMLKQKEDIKSYYRAEYRDYARILSQKPPDFEQTGGTFVRNRI